MNIYNRQLKCHTLHIIVGVDRLHIHRPILWPPDAAVDPCSANVIAQL